MGHLHSVTTWETNCLEKSLSDSRGIDQASPVEWDGNIVCNDDDVVSLHW